jgi:hypothetical protein
MGNTKKITEMKGPNRKTDTAILAEIISALKLTKNAFSNKLKYKSAMSIYNVLEGKNGISDDMAARIVHTFPEVDFSFIRTGEGTPIKIGAIPSLQRNLLNLDTPAKTGIEAFADMPDTLLRIERLLERLLEK